jgi:hypothetical protein
MRRTIIMAIIILVLAALILTLGPAACNKIRSMGAQNRVNTGQAGAGKESAVDAINTQGTTNARERAGDEQTKQSLEEIRNAKGADAPVDPGVNNAGRRGLCAIAAYRNDPKCRVREPASK